ncbi:hypothetical protein KG918_000706 [Salmonella enterica]|uniref:Uncharacterized protein n=1 Tax=Salmonella enterica subsp. salamae serovar 47:b:1,5 TaxID=1967619 RepID=A0A701UAY2_SALER|nr:hypothetical protein [Salmonella enterica]EDW4289970.1 hypothetical protein [Salmonella enterica subsp. diarizonae]EGO1765320.1 hypothetical protein [Salmonella enterica subsp. diarizonae serovar Rough:-:-]HAC6515975.1 hypothetical protein [Salmonella enterica subsp. salamae serovar 47:b:1,5]HAE2325555.1 hypothetical protein [Salmonella enterica subsp. diarizonae serovar 65:(k):z]EAM0981020.1 hypothetical protein [Salmonella enterica]
MNKYRKKNNKNMAVANVIVKNNSKVKQCFGFVDNRPEPISSFIINKNSNEKQPDIIQRQILSVKIGDELKWFDDESFNPKFFATEKEAENDRFLRRVSRRPEINPGVVPIFDINSGRHDSGLSKAMRYALGAEAPESLAKHRFESTKGQQDKFQTLDPKLLSAALYGQTDGEKIDFLLLASENPVTTKDIKSAPNIGEAEAVFSQLRDTDKRKAIEEALTMRALSQRNPYITNVRRPPSDIAGKYDYLIDLPEFSGVPVDPKTVVPYMTKHWSSGKQSKAQRKQEEHDIKRGVDPDLPIKVAREIALTREAEPSENYARWLVSNGNAQLHELGEIHESGEYRFKGIIITNVAYIDKLQQQDLNKYKTDPRVLEYFNLQEEDLERIIEVSPDI